MSWEKDIYGRNPDLALDLYVWRSYLWIIKTLAGLMHLFKELHIVDCSKEGKQIADTGSGLYCGQFGWPLMSS